MKTMAKAVMLLVVLGLCLPCYGEILVYKLTDNGTYYQQEGEPWQLDKGPWKSYMIVEVDYTDNTITQAEVIGYETWRDGSKHFDRNQFTFEWVRVEVGTTVRWIMMVKEAQVDGDQISGGFHMLAGLARDRNVGTGEKQEAANKLTGYGLQDEVQEDGRSIGITTLSATLYPAWTYWANGDGEDEGGQSFEAIEQKVLDYLEAKGYTEQPQ